MALSNLERKTLFGVQLMLIMNKEMTICHALTLEAKKPIYAAACDRLKRYIQNALGGEESLESWQRRNGINHDPEQLQKDRIAWIKWMLDQPELTICKKVATAVIKVEKVYEAAYNDADPVTIEELIVETEKALASARDSLREIKELQR